MNLELKRIKQLAGLNESSESNYIKTVLSPYNIPENLLKIGNEHVIVSLPDADDMDSVNPGVKKLIDDLRSQKFRPERLASYSIASHYVKDNDILLRFANIEVVNKPRYLYHWTPTENVESILEHGLQPRTGDWSFGKGLADSATVYNAIFMCLKPSVLAKNPGFQKYRRPTYTLLMIDTSGVGTLWKDPATWTEGDPLSYLTYDAISPQFITMQIPKEKTQKFKGRKS